MEMKPGGSIRWSHDTGLNRGSRHTLGSHASGSPARHVKHLMKKNPLIKIAMVPLAMAGVLLPEADGALALVNGNFQDTTGLTAMSGGWYSGVPAGWTGRNVTYTAQMIGGNVVANLEQVATTSGGFQPLYQDLGVLDADSTVTLTFTISQPWNSNVAQAGAGIWSNTTYSNALASRSNMTPGTYTLTAENVAAGTAIRIGFWRSLQNNAPGLDNVSITVTPVPEPSVAIMAAPLLSCLIMARRRTSKLPSHS